MTHSPGYTHANYDDTNPDITAPQPTAWPDITAEAPVEAEPARSSWWRRRITARVAVGIILLTAALGVGIGELLRPADVLSFDGPDRREEPAPPTTTVPEADTPPAGTLTTTPPGSSTSTTSTSTTTVPPSTTSTTSPTVAPAAGRPGAEVARPAQPDVPAEAPEEETPPSEDEGQAPPEDEGQAPPEDEAPDGGETGDEGGVPSSGGPLPDDGVPERPCDPEGQDVCPRDDG